MNKYWNDYNTGAVVAISVALFFEPSILTPIVWSVVFVLMNIAFYEYENRKK